MNKVQAVLTQVQVLAMYEQSTGSVDSSTSTFRKYK